MPTRGPLYPKGEYGRRGDAIYDRDLRAILEPDHIGKLVLIDIETEAYEVDTDELAMTDRLYARFPDAQPWMRRVGSPSYVTRFGYRRGVDRS